ncbi:hypothetical protein PR048_025402 [Dryococelus australis]|uniref:Uncharacterized protein n=1 Tax=Dryococelus australis TaxID=614101 RepID=A0ABQ9GR84_9NEOP|nr:hypothetical protein PR048_025402 [Dryococelus australis]
MSGGVGKGRLGGFGGEFGKAQKMRGGLELCFWVMREGLGIVTLNIARAFRDGSATRMAEWLRGKGGFPGLRKQTDLRVRVSVCIACTAVSGKDQITQDMAREQPAHVVIVGHMCSAVEYCAIEVERQDRRILRAAIADRTATSEQTAARLPWRRKIGAPRGKKGEALYSVMSPASSTVYPVATLGNSPWHNDFGNRSLRWLFSSYVNIGGSGQCTVHPERHPARSATKFAGSGRCATLAGQCLATFRSCNPTCSSRSISLVSSITRSIPIDRVWDWVRCHLARHPAPLTTLALLNHQWLVSLAKWVRFPEGSLPNFCIWESCRTIQLVSGFARGSPVSLFRAFWRCSILTSLLITSMLRVTKISSLTQISLASMGSVLKPKWFHGPVRFRAKPAGWLTMKRMWSGPRKGRSIRCSRNGKSYLVRSREIFAPFVLMSVRDDSMFLKNILFTDDLNPWARKLIKYALLGDGESGLGPPRGAPATVESERVTDLLTNSQCDKRTEHMPRRMHRDANPPSSDYKSATLHMSYENRAQLHHDDNTYTQFARLSSDAVLSFVHYRIPCPLPKLGKRYATRSYAVVTHCTHIREDPGSIPGSTILISVFSWFPEITPDDFWNGSLPIPSPIPLSCATYTIFNDHAVDETLSPTTNNFLWFKLQSDVIVPAPMVEWFSWGGFVHTVMN